MRVDFLNYVKRHWQGNFSLSVSFWINFLLLYFILNFLERYIFPPYIQGELAVTNAVIAFTVIVRLIIYPWQVVGVIRACDRAANTNIDRYWIIAAQGIVVMSIVGTVVSTFSSYQSVLSYKQSFLPLKTYEVAPEYTLELVRNNSLLHIRGPIQPGITRRVSELIAQQPAVKGIILNSSGGQIYEGRGLARIIRENRLQTYALEKCISACTTAFIAGSKRWLGENARLGFHQYKKYTTYPQINIAEEQARDKTLFAAQGISPEFLRKIFDKPPEEIWWPQIDELLRAKVIHGAGFSLVIDAN